MNQQSSRQSPEPPGGQRVYGQQEWKQDLPPSQLSLYNQLSQTNPGQFQRLTTTNAPPPRRQSGIWQWYTSRTKKVKLSIVCSVILALLLFFSTIGTVVGSDHHATPSARTPTRAHNQAAVTSQGVWNQPTPILTPIHHQTPNLPTRLRLRLSQHNLRSQLLLRARQSTTIHGVITFCLAS